MKVARFLYKNNIHFGRVEDNFITLASSRSAKDTAPFKNIKLTAQKIPLSKVKLLPPVNASKIILVGLNYKDHAQELGMPIPHKPLIFLKPNTTLIGHQQSIIYPQGVKRLDYEAELAVVVAKTAKAIPERSAAKYILGYTCLNDVTARDLQKKDIQWTRCKSFDTFCPLGPWLETELNPANLKIKLYLNGKLKQNSSTANFVFSIEYLFAFISRIMTLLPGDVISTGTPVGVGQMKKGDIVEVEIEGIGRLSNRVI